MQAEPIVLNMYKQGLIEQPVFAFWLNNDLSQSNGGELFLGGNNPEYYVGKLMYVPLASAKSWEINVDKWDI